MNRFDAVFTSSIVSHSNLFLRVIVRLSDPALFVGAHRMPDFFEDEVVALERALAIPCH